MAKGKAVKVALRRMAQEAQMAVDKVDPGQLRWCKEAMQVLTRHCGSLGNT